ncbi:MAG: GHMP family kinase ATP-binding protein [Armatimonadota bacterium]
MRHVTASAPSRIDFGGGTLDIFPLYLFFGGSITINAAIDLGAQVWLTERPDNRITIRSLDTGHALESAGLDDLPLDGPLALISRGLKYLRPQGGLDVQTKLLPPHGSGLGASSALFITLAHAVLAYMDLPRDPERIINLCNNLEAQLMGTPAGSQDYYPPTYGGIMAVHYEIENRWMEPLDPDGTFTAKLQDYLVLVNTRLTHHSGTTNWSKIRNYFDRVPETVDCLQRARDNAFRFYEAFKARDIRQIADLLAVEWEVRKGFAATVTNPDIERMMGAAYRGGAWGGRISGAGGGGCLFVIAPPEKRQEVIAELVSEGCDPLDVHIVRDGIQVDVSEVQPA